MKKNNVYIKISNRGEIDINGLHLMGVTDKRGKEKIGFFGSGNKYAIALLIREKIPFKIFSGVKEIKIGTRPVMFRGQLFEQIIVGGQKTSLTAQMGIDWETWFTIREFYCNALDEGDAKIEIVKNIKPSAGKTIVYIGLTEKLSKFFKNINNYILVNYKPLTKSKTFYGSAELLPRYNEGEFVCYRKGIRIYPKNKQSCLYWYNFSDISINESRVYKYEYQIKEQIASFLTVTDSREVILNFLRNWEGKFEEGLNWGPSYVHDNFSNTWHELLKGKRIYPKSIAIQSGDFEGKYNSFIVPDGLAEKIHSEIRGCDVVGKGKGKECEIVEPSEEIKDKVKTALEELQAIDYSITSKIQYVVPAVDDVVGWYEKEGDTIFLATKYLTTITEIKNTLLEEYFHSKGLADGNRSFVTFLINEIIRLGSK